jgi:DNA-binding response OmpR family regulator
MHKILVVDDEAPIRHIFRRVLERAGYGVVEAADGEEAMRLFANGDIDLVILDLHLPNQAVAQTLRLMRGVHATVPIIAISGWAMDLEHAMLMGASVTFVKPFSLDVLRAEIRKRLGQGE